MIMIENRFAFVHRVQQFSHLLLLAAFGVACGGTSLSEGPNDKDLSSSGGHGDHSAGAGGTGAVGGHVDNLAGSGNAAGAGITTAGSGGIGGESAGAAGTGASAGSIGGAGGNGGTAGMGQAGSSGGSSVCHATPAQPCGGGPITLARSCVSEEMASVGTSLPAATCRVMCESIIAYCSISAVAQTTVTVQCNTGCPTAPQ